jgi:hypothetical protein
MDRATLKRELVDAEREVAQGEHAINRLRLAILELERDGRDPFAAQRRLAELEQVQRDHLARRDRLRRELSV